MFVMLWIGLALLIKMKWFLTKMEGFENVKNHGIRDIFLNI